VSQGPVAVRYPEIGKPRGPGGRGKEWTRLRLRRKAAISKTIYDVATENLSGEREGQIAEKFRVVRLKLMTPDFRAT
jgi:hypothetical protein